MLQKYVKTNDSLEGISLNTVDYVGLSKDENYQKYVNSFASIDFTQFDADKNRDVLISLFANVYNALAMKMTIDYPCTRDVFGYCSNTISSIVDSGGIGIPQLSRFVETVWKRRVFNLGGEMWSLDDVENYLRGYARSELPKNAPQQLYKPDFRIHANIVCASISCPNVPTQAFYPELYDFQFTLNLNNFIKNKQKGFAVVNNNLYLSKIFDWFTKDFTIAVQNSNNTMKETPFSPIGFLLYYLYPDSEAFKTLSQSHFMNLKKEEISFFDYNWNINSEPGKQVTCTNTRVCFHFEQVLVIVILGAIAYLCCCALSCCLCCFCTIYICKKRRQQPKGYNIL